MTVSSSRCRKCGRLIWFGVTVKLRRQPLDLVPVDDGTVVLDRVGAAQVEGARVRTLTKGEVVGEDVQRWMPHPATCPKRGR